MTEGEVVSTLQADALLRQKGLTDTFFLEFGKLEREREREKGKAKKDFLK